MYAEARARERERAIVQPMVPISTKRIICCANIQVAFWDWIKFSLRQICTYTHNDDGRTDVVHGCRKLQDYLLLTTSSYINTQRRPTTTAAIAINSHHCSINPMVLVHGILLLRLQQPHNPTIDLWKFIFPLRRRIRIISLHMVTIEAYFCDFYWPPFRSAAKIVYSGYYQRH